MDKTEQTEHILKRVKYLTALLELDKMRLEDDDLKPETKKQVLEKHKEIEEIISNAIKIRHEFKEVED